MTACRSVRMLERWNTHFSKVVEQELFNITLQLSQDPSSNNLGTTVWDASIVLAKYIEKNSRRGDFSRNKVRGKRVLELGAGMGLSGMAMALLGCDVAFTDIGDVLPLLRHNVSQNVSPAALKLKDAAWAAAEVGATLVTSLDWSDPSCYSDFQPPYDFILAADCVYSELAVPHLLATVLHMGGPRTQTIVTNEFRSQAVHDIFMHQFGQHFTIRKVQMGKMDPNYQHPLIHIYLLKKRKQALEDASEDEEALEEEEEDGVEAEVLADGGHAAGPVAWAEAPARAPTAPGGRAGEAAAGQQVQQQAAQANGAELAEQVERVAQQAEQLEKKLAQAESVEQLEGEQQVEECEGVQQAEGEQQSEGGTKSQQQFQTRRQGNALARMLADVKM